MDSSARELQNALIRSIFRRTDCHFPAISGPISGRKWSIENPALNVNLFGFQPSRNPNLAKTFPAGVYPPSLWGLGLLDRLYASYRRNTLETTISPSIWLDLGGTVESTLRFCSKIQVRDPNWRPVSTIPIGIWILDPRSELIQGKEWQKGTEVSKCVESIFCASTNRKFKNAQNEILDV